MRKGEKTSVSVIKTICISIILILISGIGVMAVNTSLKDVKIVLQDGYELKVFTAKSRVNDVLEENNIVLEDNQKTIPDANEKIDAGTIIKIVDKSYNEIQVANLEDSADETTLDELLDNYAPITEKIVIEQVEIPYETLTQNVENLTENTTNRVVQEGENGLKEVTYKVKFQNDVEIEKNLLFERTIKEPVNKIIQVNKVVTSRSATTTRKAQNTTAKSTTASSTGATRTFKVTAYCPCRKCCGKTTGITAMGTHATAGRTVAASSQFAFGTKLNINGHVYTVEDRGGAIQGNKIDIFVNSHAEALAWGVRYLSVSVVN